MPLLNKINNIQIIALLIIFGQGFFSFSQTKTFQIDPNKSQVKFKVSHFGVLSVKGVFETFSGSILISENTLQKIKSEIQVSSINTNDTTRDDSLKDEAYLDVKNYPLITFNSTYIDLVSETKIITGKLKIKGIEKHISMPFEMLKDGNYFHIKIITTIKRTDFNLDFGAMDSFVGDEIKLEILIITQ